MKKNKCIESFLPYDLDFKIVSSLQEVAPGSGGIYVGLILYGNLYVKIDGLHSIVLDNQDSEENVKGWRAVYATKHAEMAKKADLILNFLDPDFSSFEGMHSMQFGFQDVEMFFFKPKMNLLLNLAGLHYCINALNNLNIQSRQVCVQWWKLGRWHYGHRLQDDMQSREVSLADLAEDKRKEVLSVLHRGAVHEVLRVRITNMGHNTSTRVIYGRGSKRQLSHQASVFAGEKLDQPKPKEELKCQRGLKDIGTTNNLMGLKEFMNRGFE
ncbi:hypothetical protein Leryth_005807 [Lithospermum erythrorhizon]|nr:hypothetical protein Leryth_005807 [Lithospermum erythrorhizon]